MEWHGMGGVVLCCTMSELMAILGCYYRWGFDLNLLGSNPSSSDLFGTSLDRRSIFGVIDS